MTLNSAQTGEDTTPSLVSPHLVSVSSQFRSPLKLGVMASGSGSNFEAIARAIAAKELPAQIQVLIYNNPDAKVTTRAQRWHVPTKLLNHRDFEHREDLDDQIVQTLQQFEVEWVVMAGWMRRVTQVLIDAFPDRILNIHPSLLPSFRGMRAIEQALDQGVRISGCTVHVVRLDIDNGPIIQQAAVPVFPDDTSETLHARIQEQEHKILPQAIMLAASSFNKDSL